MIAGHLCDNKKHKKEIEKISFTSLHFVTSTSTSIICLTLLNLNIDFLKFVVKDFFRYSGISSINISNFFESNIIVT